MNQGDREEMFDSQWQFNRIVSTQYVGYLVGQLKEIIEASTADKEQRTSLKNIVADKVYEWWNRIGDKITPEEADRILKEHWDKLDTLPDGTKVK